MKKAILISESKRFTKTVLNLVSDLSQSFFIVGGFAHTLNYSELVKTSAASNPTLVEDLIERDQETVDQNLLSFTEYCNRQLIKCRVYEEDYLLEIANLVTESRFADLLFISNRCFEKSDDGLKRTFNLKQVLHKVECPVLVLPEIFQPLKRVIIAYDGKKESMFAIKQFCYLFPEYLELPVEIVYLGNDDYNDVPKVALLKEYVMQNFSSVNICQIEVDPKDGFAGWVSSRKDSLVVAGAYSRTGMFNSSINSFIDPVLEMQLSPVFIAHH
jgi:hypothetical protein